MASSAAPQITVHWLDQSRAQRILWLLEELALPYEVKTYARHPKTLLAPAELREVHPLGKSPVVTIKEEGQELLTLAESGAISQFLVERYGAKTALGAPADGDIKRRAEWLYWVNAAEGSFMTSLMVKIIFSQVVALTPYPVKPIAWIQSSQVHKQFIDPRISENFGHINSVLLSRPFLLGDELSAADVMIYFPVEGVVAALGEKECKKRWPALMKWFTKCGARPAFKRAEDRGGKNDMTVFLK